MVRHAELYGSRETKYEWLNAHDQKKTQWRELKPASPFYLFVPQDRWLEAKYCSFLGVSEIFPVNGVGIITRKDGLTIRWSQYEMWNTVQRFVQLSPELARAGYQLGADTTNWQVARAQKDLLDSGPTRENIVPILYRAFDTRFTYFTGKSNGFHSRPCYEVMRHMLAGENLALVAPKQHKDEFGALVAESIGAHKSVAAYDINYYFPLYLYPTADLEQLFVHHEEPERKSNLNPAVVAALVAAYAKEPAPEEIFHYIYAVLYAPAYRTKYAEFVRLDFPRIPFTADSKLFGKLAALGEKLAGLHLLKSPDLDPPACRFEGEGDGRIGKDRKAGLRYDAAEQRVYINAAQHFAPVPEPVWTYQVGGYQVCEKWLKDRKERRLELDDIRTYCRIVTALTRTIEIQQKIDALYPDAERNTVPMTSKGGSRDRQPNW